MQKSNKKEINLDDYSITIKMATFITVVIVVAMTLLYCIRIYSATKESVMSEMKSESELIETVIADNLNYSKYFLYLISNSIEDNTSNLDLISEELSINFKSQEFNKLFGWRKYSWIDKNNKEVVNSIDGIVKPPAAKPFIEEALKDKSTDKKGWNQEVVFHTKRDSTDEDSSLKIIDFVVDKDTNEYLGSAVLSYDIMSMVNSLNDRKKQQNTSFIIVDENFKFVAASALEISHLLTNGDILSPSLLRLVRELKDDEGNSKMSELSYLDMISGLNYHISRLEELPFYVVVSMDNTTLRMGIVDNIAKKLIEVSLISILSLLLVAAVYKRETSLRSRAEQASKVANEASESKTNFLSFTAHEIRSPLAFILTGSEMLYKELLGPLPQNYKKYAEGINQNANLILNFITDILDENQILEGKFKIVNSTEDIEEIVSAAIKQNTTRYNKRTLNIKTDFALDVPLLICDGRRMFQVVSNIISNSIKYSEDPVEIKVKIEIENSLLAISISDNGIGMTEEEIEIALSAYGSAQKSNIYAIESYGLGLPIVKMLLDSHNAALKIISYPNEGTTVKITFPRYKLVHKVKKNTVIPKLR